MYTFYLAGIHFIIIYNVQGAEVYCLLLCTIYVSITVFGLSNNYSVRKYALEVRT